jgi:hypothetical protein
MDAFVAFEPALKRGDLKVQPGEVHPDILVHFDSPNGEMRLTYAKVRGESLVAIAIIVRAEPLNGLPVFQIGYAVPQHLRKRGLAKEIAQAAIDEFTNGIARGGITSFYIEAVVGVRNVASQKVAGHVIGGQPEEIEDDDSGEPALQYTRKIGS